MENKIVTIKPIKKNALGNLSRIPSSTYTIVAKLTRVGYETGLTPAEEKKLEKELGLEANTLSKRSPYWKAYAFKIPGDSSVTLDLSEAQSYLDYRLCLACTEVADSEEDINTLTHDFFIADDEKKANKELVRIKQHDNAIIAYTKMSVKDMRDVLKLLGYKTANMSETYVQTALRSEIDENPTKFNNIVEDPDFQEKVFIKDLEYYKILSKDGTKYYFGEVNNVIGNSIEDAVEYLNDKANNQIKIQLHKALQKEKGK